MLHCLIKKVTFYLEVPDQYFKKCHIRKQFIQPKTNTHKNTECSNTLSKRSTDCAISINSYHNEADKNVQDDVSSSSTEEYDSQADNIRLSSSECSSDLGWPIKIAL